VNLGLLLLAQSSVRTVFEWGRIREPSDWILPLLVLAVVLAFVRWAYRRDSAELSPAIGWFLTTLRGLAILLLWLIYMQPQWRAERDVTQNSRALLLVDTSLSMGLDEGESPDHLAGESRADQVIKALTRAGLLKELRKKHDVLIDRFDEVVRPVASLPKLGSTPVADSRGAAEPVDEHVDFREVLAPRGTETRLGQALEQVVDQYRSAAPVSGLVLFSDGGQNAGVGPAAATRLARDSGIPIHIVGLGSDRAPANVRVRELLAPARVYPGDSFTVSAEIQAEGPLSGTLTVELWSQPTTRGSTAADADAGRLEGSKTVTVAGDGDLATVTFEVTPEQIGSRTLRLLLKPPSGDSNPEDNEQQADVEVVDRKTHVLLLAGGPMREYRFLRTQLFRDEQIDVDVLLQTAEQGIAQEANRILDVFPETPEEMFSYDALVALDPNWLALTPEQVGLLQRWVDEQAGGLVVVAGPIHTQAWAQSAAMNKIRALYPVEFDRSFSLAMQPQAGGTEPWPIEFTRDGIDTNFLRLEGSASQSMQAWSASKGVYRCFPVRGAKPGATVLANFGDPRAGGGEPLPLMVTQFYGAGRVFYLGTGEMWRLRSVNPDDFERFYTQVIRYVSQGRLLRGSPHGSLMVERDRYTLGQMISLRARLLDEQLRPLESHSVTLEAISPEGEMRTVTLVADGIQPGSFVGHLMARHEGAYQLALDVPGAGGERLTRRVQVRMPDLERKNPKRNDALLAEIAADSGGTYLVGINAALDPQSGLPALLKDRSKTVVKIDAPRPLWDSIWVLLAICGLLCLEWLVRRLVRLA